MRKTLCALAALAAILLPTTAAATAQAAGTRDFTYSAGVSAPTGQKPQSKLWFNDGSWWGVLWSRANQRYDIWRFDWAADSWTDTGVAVDPRSKGNVDVLWDGTKLFVTSNVMPGANTTDTAGRLWRFSYAAGRYTRDAGFPTTVVASPVEALVMDKDSQGNLWATYTLDQPNGSRALFVRRTVAGDQTRWGTAFTPAVTGASNLNADDISALVAFKDPDGTGKVGVMWSNQTDGAMYFIVHVDGAPDSAWTQQPAIGPSPGFADDHMAVRALNGDARGNVVAVMKTSLNDHGQGGLGAPLIQVAVRSPEGVWSKPAVFSRVADDHTRAIVQIDREHRRLYVAASAPCCSGGKIYVKQTSLDNPDFSGQTGLGTEFIGNATDLNINNPTSTKQELSSTTGLLIEASDDHTKTYLHGRLDLGAATPPPAPPDTTITSAGPADPTDATAASFTFTATPATGATFECRLDAAAFAPCTSPVSYTGLAAGTHAFEVRAVSAAGTDPTPAQRTWTINAAPGAPLFADDFETGNLARWTTVTTASGGTATVQSATVAQGTFAARLSETATAGSSAYVRRALGSNRTSLTVTGAFNVDTEGASGGNVPLLRLFGPTGARVLNLYRQNLSSNGLFVSDGTTRGQLTRTLPLRTWARFEVRVTAAGTGASTVTVLVDGVQAFTTTTMNVPPTGIATVQLGNETAAQAFALVADDIAVR